MIRNCSLEEISDGRLYGLNDLVKADTAGCSGCTTKCCYGMGDTIVLDPYDVYRLEKHLGQTFEQLLADKIAINKVDDVLLPNLKMGMGDTIVLDPYDVYRLEKHLGQTFEQLLADKIAINKVDDVLLPNLKMNEKTGGCAFLNEEERCTVHGARPAMCRLFPLGRYWADEETFHYILQTGQCKKSNLSKIKVKKWIDCDNIKEYDEYVVLWHKYIKRISVHYILQTGQCKKSNLSKIKVKKWIDCDNIKEYDEYVVLWHKYIKRISVAINECMQTSDSQLAATQVKTICMYTLKTFYMAGYNFDKDFFVQFKERLYEAYHMLGIN